MSGQQVWNERAQSIYDALTRRLGQPVGDGGRGTKAFREASRRLATAGVRADDVGIVLSEYAAEVLRSLGPMPLATFAAGGEARDARWLIANRWPTTCATCSSEIGRGEMAWFRKPSGAERATLTCGTCEEIDFISERADAARKRALEREQADGDADDMLARILEHTPGDLRAAVEDGLPMSLFAEGA